MPCVLLATAAIESEAMNSATKKHCHVHSVAIYVLRAIDLRGSLALPEHASEAVMHVKVHLRHAVVEVVGDQQCAPGGHTDAAPVSHEL